MFNCDPGFNLPLLSSLKKFLKSGILLIILTGFFPFNSYALVNGKSDFSSYLSRLENFRNHALSYAYYLRAAYLRKRVEHFKKRNVTYYQARNDVYESSFLMKKALDYAPDSFYLWLQYSIVNEELGNLPKVVLAYKNLVKISPTAELCQKLGVLYEIYNQPDLAIGQYKYAARLAPDDLSIQERIVDLYIQQAFKQERLNNFDIAKSFFAEASEKIQHLISLKQKPRYVLKYGLLCELLGKPNDALEAYKQTIKIDPEEIDAYIRAARIYCAFAEKNVREGESELAVSNYFKASRLMTKIIPEKVARPELLNFTAYILALANTNLNFAEDLVKEALKNDENNTAYIDTLGWVLYKKGNAQEALKNILKAVNNGGDDPVLLDHLGDVYFKLGEIDKAKSMWQKSLELDKNNISVKKKLEKTANNNPTDE